MDVLILVIMAFLINFAIIPTSISTPKLKLHEPTMVAGRTTMYLLLQFQLSCS